MLQSLRGYFFGVTIVALFNAVVVGVGALGGRRARGRSPDHLPRRVRPVSRRVAAGAFSVLLALGGAGTDAAIGMIVIQLLANGILQQLVQPIAYGAALGIHPLAVLLVTIGGGACSARLGRSSRRRSSRP